MPTFIRIVTVIALVSFLATASFSQSLEVSILDNNPRLTTQESEWLNNHINRGDFDFKGKYVAFSQLLTGGFYGIGKFMLRLPKKNVFHEKISETLYQLYVLSEEEKRQTNGYDAIIVFGDKKHKGKMRRLKRESVIADNFNRYPQIPAEAGNDNNPLLDSVNVAFFNEIYKGHEITAQGFDFAGKKVAIFNTHCRFGQLEQETIARFVSRVRKSLEEHAFYITEFTYLLNEAQKKESGGYDLIIQYRCKMDVPLQTIIDRLKESP